MPVGWALVGSKTEPADIPKLLQLKELARKTNKPWAEAVQFTVKPLSVFWTKPPRMPREWDVCVEIDQVSSERDLKDIFQFMEANCSHVDGLGG